MAATIELTKRAANGVPMPPDDVLRQLLTEATDSAAADILGCADESIALIRKRLKLPAPWRENAKAFRVALGTVVRHRWADYPDSAPEPIRRADLAALAIAENKRVEGQAPEQKQAAPMMTPGEALIHLQRFEQQHHRWPTYGELAAFTDRTESQIRDKLARLIRDGMAEWEGHTIRVVEREAAGIVTTETWCQTCLTRHLRKLGVSPTPRTRTAAARIRDHVIGLAEHGGSTQGVDPDRAARDAERAAANHTYAPGSSGRYPEDAGL